MVVDEGARRALVEREASLLSAGVLRAEGAFQSDDAVELAGEDGSVFAKGITRLGSSRSSEWVGKKTAELPSGLGSVVVHRDDLVILSAGEGRSGSIS